MPSTTFAARVVLTLATALGSATALRAQGPAAPAKRINPASAAPMEVSAARSTHAPSMDARDDDPAWKSAPLITGFRVMRPVEDGNPAYRTEARVLYDAKFIYVLVRAFDPHPDSIVGLLARRDAQTPSDIITLFLDPFHDRRTGFEFTVNPVGVKTDFAITQDGNEDIAWDGIWDAATRVDSLGWVAEFRIPLSQLRYRRAPTTTFGFAIFRTVERNSETSSWPLYRVSRPGLASQLGNLTGLDSLAPPSHAEIAPYVVTKNASVAGPNGFSRSQQISGGADFKVAVAPNLSVTGTVNPDFGQVEADPAVLNLSAFETFFQERRPFFVEGSGLFQFNVNCSQVNCSNEQLFYSRRIGRSPQLGGQYGNAQSPSATTILGAGKLTGRVGRGLTIGVIDAVTQRESGINNATIEPATNYAVIRATQDLAGGTSGVGIMLTGVNRSLDSYTTPALHRDAYVGALEVRHQFLGRRFQLTGSLDWSRVAGSAAAIAQTQLSPVHLYQRPDGPLTFDPSRTSLSGDAEEIHFAKISGVHTQFETSYMRRSAGFDVNDLGFLRQADQQSWSTWFGLSFNKPTQVYQSLRWNLNWWQYWTAGGLATERAANTNVHAQLKNRWWIHAGGTLGQLGTTSCDRCARGGPAVRQDPYVAPWMGIAGDDRHKLIPSFWVNYSRVSGSQNTSLNLNPTLTYNASTRFSAGVGANIETDHTDNQWFDNIADHGGVMHYTFAHLDQKTVSLTTDLSYTVTPTLSLQWHIQPFLSRGTYTNLREIANPNAPNYADRYKAVTDTAMLARLGGLNAKQLNANMVLRWEYRHGSTLFLVWTQGRNDFQEQLGNRSVGGDLRQIFDLRPDNTFLVKVSYWLSQ